LLIKQQIILGGLLFAAPGIGNSRSWAMAGERDDQL